MLLRLTNTGFSNRHPPSKRSQGLSEELMITPGFGDASLDIIRSREKFCAKISGLFERKPCYKKYERNGRNVEKKH